ncbi:MAG: HEAT repeat domain-containing protein [Candidatus Jordarchaeum sp.]|uniref:HEAT repeat domain-containing protein n=1 Tax=Candidatus Jordarchaeum sp. TaxID=2823881 RepID=UPI00404A2925
MKIENLEKQISLLNDSDRMKRSHAAFNVARYAMLGVLDKKALEPLTKLLKDADREVRMNSAFAVGEYASHNIFDKAIPRLLVKLLKDWSSKVRCRATTSLGEYAKMGFYNKKIIKPLLRFLTDDDKELRANAAWTLGIYAVKDILEKNNSDIVEKILKTRDPNVKIGLSLAAGECAWNNGQIRERVLEAFIGLLNHEDFQVREGIAFIIGQNAEQKHTDKRILNPLLDLLRDSHPAVRINAIFALVMYARRGIKTKYLVKKLSNLTRDPDKDVKETLQNFLYKINLEKSSNANSV